MTAPPLVLTCGEPSGIGPEIAVAARGVLGDTLPFFLLGDPDHFPSRRIAVIADPAEASGIARDLLPILPHRFPVAAVPGRPAPENAQSVIDVIARAVDLVRAGRAGAVVTNPISKAALKRGAGFAWPGHTEYLAHLAGVDQVVMMLACDDLRVVPVTIHEPLAAVPGLLTEALLEAVLRITEAGLRSDFNILRPRIAVAGLNPHAGEAGTMGTEDARVIAPVIARLAAGGMAVTGPWPADTMFHAAARGRYDVAVAMYHDQALIPIKTLAFDEGVNVTLGLPFVRTSPDHGTAFDIAGKGLANPSSLIAALRMAAAMVDRRA